MKGLFSCRKGWEEIAMGVRGEGGTGASLSPDYFFPSYLVLVPFCRGQKPSQELPLKPLITELNFLGFFVN